MKKLFISLACLATALWSEEPAPFLIQVGGNYSYVHLKPSDLYSFKGNLGGVQFSYEYMPRNHVYEGVTFLWREGTTTDNDSLKRSLFDADTQVRLGYSWNTSRERSITPFTGFGWRYIGQELSGAGAVLDLNYNEVYIPVGILIRYQINCSFTVGLNGIWMPQVFPNVNFVPLDNARWVTQCTLGNFQLELPLIYLFNYGCWNGSLELRPFFQYWQDGHTLASTSTGIPLNLDSNTYYFGGFQANFGVRF